MGSAFTSIQTGVANALGNLNLPGVFTSSLQPNPGNTTTAVNLGIVVNGVLQGLIRSMSVDESFNYQRVPAIGSAVSAALVPGVYEATATCMKTFLFGQTLETAFGGGLRAVTGRYQADPDFTKFYFNIVELDNKGAILAVRHDCVLMSVRSSYEIGQVVIMQDATIAIRWSETS